MASLGRLQGNADNVPGAVQLIGEALAAARAIVDGEDRVLALIDIGQSQAAIDDMLAVAQTISEALSTV